METIKGGEFLIKESIPENVFIPHEWDEEQKMIAQSCSDFMAQEVETKLDEMDAMQEGLMPSLLKKAGELGMLGVSVPEQYGGFGKDFVTSMMVTELSGSGHSFSVAFSAHTGIGTLPILYYGNEKQKQKYLPKLATGEWAAAYCLTEPGSGSDANSGKTKATLTDNGKHYIINGQKMWITNAGFAHVFTVFAKIDGDENLSAFILEADYDGLTLNPEEKKMGIKGSSTRQVFFNNVKVPVENLLSERGNGFKIALNILNIGRIKLGGGVLGGAKKACGISVKYANEREQFGRAISKYGAIRYKIAEQAIQIYALESAVYRVSRNVDEAITSLEKGGMSHADANLKGREEYASEAAIIKVLGSEVLDYVVDEGVQIYGGMGYSAESPVERAYRDSRINRIFEGTNEINRMLIVDMLLKRAMKGQLDLMTHAQKVASELFDLPTFNDPTGELFENESKYVKNFKKAVLMVAGSAVQKLMMTLSKEQEILMNIADMIILTYSAESTLLRVKKLAGLKGEENITDQIAIAKTYIYDAADKINKYGKDALTAFAEGDDLSIQLMGLKRFTKTKPLNTKKLRQQIALALIDKNDYCY